jgi:hypothetical protein
MERYAISLPSPLGFLLEQPLTQCTAEGVTAPYRRIWWGQMLFLTEVDVSSTEIFNEFL